MSAEACPTCTELFNLFMLRHVAAAIFDEAKRAHEMHGRWCGVLLSDSRCFLDDRSRLLADVDASRGLDCYLDVRPISELKEIARARQTHKQSAEVLRNLDVLLMDDEVPVLAVWKGCIAYVFVHPDSSVRLALLAGKVPGPFDDDYMRFQLLGPKEPRNEAANVVSPPSRAVKSDDATPAMAQRPSRAETLMLDARLVRMVLRVSPDLQEDLITISERLFDETRLEYSYAAVLRGLIALGLASIAGKVSLAVEFAGARVPRGRKRSERKNLNDPADE